VYPLASETQATSERTQLLKYGPSSKRKRESKAKQARTVAEETSQLGQAGTAKKAAAPFEQSRSL
jgi:hypothetical protein